MSNYTSPESLVETSWLAEHLNDSAIRIVESNEDILLYGTGHIRNAVHIDWRADLNDPVQRDYITPDGCQTCSKERHLSGHDRDFLWRSESEDIRQRTLQL